MLRQDRGDFGHPVVVECPTFSSGVSTPMVQLTPSPTSATYPAETPAPSPAPVTRQYVRYAFYKVLPSWRSLTSVERAQAREDLLAAIEPFAARLPVLRAFSTSGTRADADLLLWVVSERIEDFQELHAAMLRSAMGAYLD